jgi:hypothetical protein
MNPFGVVKGLNVFKNKPVRLAIIPDSESVNPFPFDKRMERFYAGIIPRERFLRIAPLHFGCRFPVFFGDIIG